MATKVSKAQIKKVNVLLGKLGLSKDKEQKASIIKQYSNGRVSSTAELFVNEAGDLITELERQVGQKPTDFEADRKRKLLIHYARQMNWVQPDGKADIKRIDDWCKKYGQFHKPLMQHTSAELSHILVQFEKAYKDYLKAV